MNKKIAIYQSEPNMFVVYDLSLLPEKIDFLLNSKKQVA